VDTNWPDRYNYAARQSVTAPFAQQIANGHFAYQMIDNWYFAQGSDKLNPAGMAKLDAIARTTPAPDPKLFVQEARDIGLTPENADRIKTLRDDLTARRAAAIQRYMATQPGTPVAYEIMVTDAPTQGLPIPFILNAYRGQVTGYKGGIGGGQGQLVGGTGPGLQQFNPQGGGGAGGTGAGGPGGGAYPGAGGGPAGY
jgi:hypothetical protein